MVFSLHQLLLCYNLTSFSLGFLFINSFASYMEQQGPLCHDHEKLALLQFKQSFRVNCATSLSSSSYSKMKLWDSKEAEENSDCCNWDGVECDKNTGHVIALDLSNSCISGTFPSNSSLFTLTRLQSLNLAYNHFNFSEIPASTGSLHQLRTLNLSQSAFSGQIPPQISELSKLNSLDLSRNGDRLGSSQLNLKLHNPSLQKFVYNLTRLSQLFLDGVDVFSNVPVSLTNLTSLTVISLMYCNLEGEFPASIFQLPKLQVLVLSNNRKLTGHLPDVLLSGSFPLQKLDISATAFSGELPPSIGNFRYLNTLRLWGCRFSGKIPSSLGNLTKLTQLSLSDNDFRGEIPSSVENLTELTMFGISSLNVKTGNLGSWLPKLKKLTNLGLGDVVGLNSVNHHLSFLANLTNLSYLNLASNQITGSIPLWLVNMTQLTWLYLSENNFQGQIPEWFSQLTNLHSLSLAHNNMSGKFEILSKLKNLNHLDLTGINLTIPSKTSLNSSYLSSKQLQILKLDWCNLTEFPHFLHNQNQMQFLSLRGNNIEGVIPQWFMNRSRTTLLLLDLSQNSLTGFEQFPRVLPWYRLKFLDLTGNRLKGRLPCASNLTKIYLVSGNQFTGAIPQQICSMKSLTFLDLSDNKFSGQIPSCISKMLSCSLLALNMRGNNLHGTIPGSFPSLCKLQMINLSENQLEGALPKSLANCKMLQVLDVGKNRVNDVFPFWLRRHSELQVLVLRHNQFHGEIKSPVSSQDFPNLHVLDLSNNHHTGLLPFEFLRSWNVTTKPKEAQWDSSNIIITFYFSILDIIYFENHIYNYSITIHNKGSERFYSRILNVFQLIDFSSNNFTGQIPDFIGDFTELQTLNLSNNNLYGNIPASLSNMKALESLDLSQNMLSGKIPQELQELTSLEVFNVSYNNLTGPIPEGAQFSTFDRSSYDGNSGLCGSPLPKKCEDPNSVAPLLSMIDDVIMTLYLSGCITGLIVGFIIGKCIIERYYEWFMLILGTHELILLALSSLFVPCLLFLCIITHFVQ